MDYLKKTVVWLFKHDQGPGDWTFLCPGWLFDNEMNSQELYEKLKCQFDASSWLSEYDRQ
jgi:hypothetical protein